MNFDDLLGKLMPLFEQKVAFNMKMGERALTLEEQKEKNKTDLDYKKLESQIKNDKDKLKWEKEKLGTSIKANYDLQALKNSGDLDTERLKGINTKELQEISSAGHKDTEQYKVNMDFLAKTGTVETGVNPETGADYEKKSSRENLQIRDTLSEQMGFQRPELTPQSQTRNVAAEAGTAADIIRGYEKAGSKDAAQRYVNALPADTKQAVLSLLAPPADNQNTSVTEGQPVIPATQNQGQNNATVQASAVAPPVMNTSRQPVVPQPTNVFQQGGTAMPNTNQRVALQPQNNTSIPGINNLASGNGGNVPGNAAPGNIASAGTAKREPVMAADGYDMGKKSREDERRALLRRARGITLTAF